MTNEEGMEYYIETMPMPARAKSFGGPCTATPYTELQRQIMDPNTSKNEREWWASRRIEELQNALRPFSDALQGVDFNADGTPVPDGMKCEDGQPIDDAVYTEDQPTVGDLRRARKALEPK